MSFRSLAALVAASFAAGLGILYPFAWILAPFGLALFLYELLYKTASKRGALLRGFVFGFATGAAGVWWMWDMLPITNPTGISPVTQFVVAGSVWAVTALLAGVTTALFALLLYKFRRSKLIAVVASFLWVLQEELRMWAYALFSYSPESLFGPHFSQTALAYSLAENPYLLSLARFGGIHAMSIAVAILAITAALGFNTLIARRFEYRTGIALFLTGIVLILPLFPHESRTQPSLRIALLSFSKEPDAGTVYQLLQETASSTSDMILIPESSTFEYFFPGTTGKNVLSSLFHGNEGLIISAGYETGGTTPHSVLSYTNSKGERVASYQKMFLMPQGEYYPLVSLPLFSLSGDAHITEYVKKAGQRLTRGDGFVVLPFKGAVIGGLVCSELLSPYMYEHLVTHFGANVLVNLGNPSWFHSSKTYFDKTVEIAKVHAVENNAPLLVANNGSPSFAINANGTLIGQSTWGADEVLFVPVGH